MKVSQDQLNGMITINGPITMERFHRWDVIMFCKLSRVVVTGAI
jgi:hypothetical protein